MKRRVAVLEDDPQHLALLMSVLDGFPDLEVVMKHQDADAFEKAVETSEPLRLDIAVVDLLIDRAHRGITTIARLRKALPELYIIAHTVVSKGETLLLAHQAGADDCAIKGSSKDSLMDSLRRRFDRVVYLNPILARAVEVDQENKRLRGEFLGRLNVKQLALVHEIAKGRQAKDIAGSAEADLKDLKTVDDVNNALRSIRQILGSHWRTIKAEGRLP